MFWSSEIRYRNVPLNLVYIGYQLSGKTVFLGDKTSDILLQNNTTYRYLNGFRSTIEQCSKLAMSPLLPLTVYL